MKINYTPDTRKDEKGYIEKEKKVCKACWANIKREDLLAGEKRFAEKKELRQRHAWRQQRQIGADLGQGDQPAGGGARDRVRGLSASCMFDEERDELHNLYAYYFEKLRAQDAKEPDESHTTAGVHDGAPSVGGQDGPTAVKHGHNGPGVPRVRRLSITSWTKKYEGSIDATKSRSGNWLGRCQVLGF